MADSRARVRAWIEQAIACFNDPEDNGEDTWEVRGALQALRDEAPTGTSAEHRALLEALIAATDGLVESTYTRARLSEDDPPRLELFQHSNGEWVPASAKPAKNAKPAKDATKAPLAPRPAAGARAAWDAFAADAVPSAFRDLEASFAKKTGTQLTQLVTSLIAEGELALAEEIARAVLAERPKLPGHWWSRLAEAQLRGNPASARESVERALLFADTWMPSAVSLWFRLEEATGAGEEALAVIYVGGREHRFALDKPAAFGGIGPRRLPKPARAKARFAEAMIPMLLRAWQAEPVGDPAARRHLAGMLRRFGKAAPSGFLAEVEGRAPRTTARAKGTAGAKRTVGRPGPSR